MRSAGRGYCAGPTIRAWRISSGRGGRRRPRATQAATAAAALALAATPTFGAVPGGVPLVLFEARARARGAARTRLAAALARAWAYAGQPERAAGFADEAQADAERLGDPTLLADALDAQLAVHWGPDQLADRLRLTDRLEEAAAHLVDVEARLSAHLWRPSTGLETLDGATVRRQLRALDLLADESGSPRVAFFAASRRGMHALLTGDLDAAKAALRDAGAAGRVVGSADLDAVEHTLRAGIARQAGDTAALATEAGSFEGFGLAEGIGSVLAWGAVLWVAAGDADRARAVLHQLGDFAAVPRDVDWLLTVCLLTDVAAAVGERAQAEVGLGLLTSYAGRGVIDAGGVAFVGVVDAVLARACALLDRSADAARWSASRTGRLTAGWARLWLPRHRRGVRRLPEPGVVPPAARRRRHLVGRAATERLLPSGTCEACATCIFSCRDPAPTCLRWRSPMPSRATAARGAVGRATPGRCWTDRRSRPTDAGWSSSTASWPRRGRTPTSPARNARARSGAALLDQVRAATGLGGRPTGRGGHAPTRQGRRPQGHRRRRRTDRGDRPVAGQAAPATPSAPVRPAVTTRTPTGRCAGCL